MPNKDERCYRYAINTFKRKTHEGIMQVAVYNYNTLMNGFYGQYQSFTALLNDSLTNC